MWKEKGVQTAKCIMEGEVWGQDCKMQTIVYLRSQNKEAWMVKPLSAGCVNTVVACCILITSDYVSQVPQRKLTRMRTRNRKLTLCGLNLNHCVGHTSNKHCFSLLTGTFL